MQYIANLSFTFKDHPINYAMLPLCCVAFPENSGKGFVNKHTTSAALKYQSMSSKEVTVSKGHIFSWLQSTANCGAGALEVSGLLELNFFSPKFGLARKNEFHKVK